jgi:two-component system, sensor histidine kinase and response regulator
MAGLKAAGAVVEVAATGQEAISALEASEFDAVLMDIQMPEMDGYEATRAIRSREKHKSLPIIAMTAHAMARDRERSLAEGMTDQISKPIDAAWVIRVVNKWVSGRGR